MHTIVTYGLSIDYNLGCPSILLGFYKLLEETYNNDFKMINLEMYSGKKPRNHLFPFDTLYIKSCNARDTLLALFFNKTISVGTDEKGLSDAFKIIKNADVVVNLYGICFCDKFGTVNRIKPLLPLYSILSFPFSYVARKWRILSIKNTASFGPIKSESTKFLARFANRHLFDYMIAREKQSLNEMHLINADKNMMFSFDTANLMPYSEITIQKLTVGVSVSHQMVRQWKNAEDYTSCIANLCIHIFKSTGATVELIPNEWNPRIAYNDVTVAEDIMFEIERLGGTAEILPVETMEASDIKNYIAACEVLVASRYHSCVAALSSGVPVLVVGWHYKYSELLDAYGQGKWLLSEDNCSSSLLIQAFDDFWSLREEAKITIIEKSSEIKHTICEIGKRVLENRR